MSVQCQNVFVLIIMYTFGHYEELKTYPAPTKHLPPLSNVPCSVLADSVMTLSV